MSGWRLFTAAPLPRHAADAVWQALAGIRQRHPEARWIAPELMHVTLVFLGPTDPALVGQIGEAVVRVARGGAPSELATGAGGGRADDRRGGVAWLSLDGPGVGQLRDLAHRLEAELPPTPGRGRLHAPHLTVARRVSDRLLAELAVPAVEFRVDRLALLRSHIGAGGARYEALAETRLGAAAARRAGSSTSN